MKKNLITFAVALLSLCISTPIFAQDSDDELRKPSVGPSQYFGISSTELNDIYLYFQSGCIVESIDEELVGETFLAPKLAHVGPNGELYPYYGEACIYYEMIIEEPNLVHMKREKGCKGIVDLGQYGMTIPIALFTTNLGTNPEWEFAWMVDRLVEDNYDAAVTGITANDKANVYNLSGVRVIENASKADLDTLAPGLYIINGKKTIIVK